MSFSFGFSGDDIETDESSIFAASSEISGQGNGGVSLNSTDDYKTKFMNSASEVIPPTIGPDGKQQDYVACRKHEIKELLEQSVGVRMSYTQCQVDFNGTSNNQGSCVVARRDLFDVKHQLMTQDVLSATDEILLGLTNEDLRIATYEGGLKSWECTFDLMQVLAERSSNGGYEYKNVLELGCGTGLPSALVLQKMLTSVQDPATAKRNLVLADYNESVLKLVTVPNLLFTWCDLQDQERLRTLQTGDQTGQSMMEIRPGEVEVTQQLVTAFLSDLESKNIKVEFVSGGWSPQFVTLLNDGGAQFDLILASETIYSPDTLPIFTDTMLCLMTKTTEALVAAKRVYFGVGGGIPEFERALELRKVQYETISEVTSQGVVRAILRVSL